MESNTLYLGPDLEELENMTLSKCCETCSIHNQCQAWVFNLLNNTCILKSSLRNGYFTLSGYSSGFVIPKCKYFNQSVN